MASTSDVTYISCATSESSSFDSPRIPSPTSSDVPPDDTAELYSYVSSLRTYSSSGFKCNVDECSYRCFTDEQWEYHFYHYHRQLQFPCTEQPCTFTYFYMHELLSHVIKVHKPGSYYCKICAMYPYRAEIDYKHYEDNFAMDITIEEDRAIEQLTGNLPTQVYVTPLLAKRDYKHHVIIFHSLHPISDVGENIKDCLLDFRLDIEFGDKQQDLSRIRLRDLMCICVRCCIPGFYHDFKDLLKHHKEKHSVYPCPLCPAAYSNSEELKFHKKSHYRGPGHYCNICDMKFNLQSALESHSVEIHNKYLNICKICKTGLKYSFGLNKHMKTIHKNKKTN